MYYRFCDCIDCIGDCLADVDTGLHWAVAHRGTLCVLFSG